MNDANRSVLDRRSFLALGGGSLAAGLMGASAAASASAISTPKIDLPPLFAPSEVPGDIEPLPLEPGKRVGYAIVGIGHLTMEAIVPAFAKTKYSRIAALVTGDRAKGIELARSLGLPDSRVYDYAHYERLADQRDVDAVYIVLPNSMHAEYTVRAAHIGKHVLCEKPMSVDVAQSQQMIDACDAAKKLLMIAYRQQYEPNNIALGKMMRDGRLGTVKQIFACNAQNEGDPDQWRHKRALAGGGALPDIGLYCLNATRFLSREEPVEVMAQTYSTPGDPRFKEIEETIHFQMRFPSGLMTQCAASYGAHLSRFMRVNGTTGWTEMSPAFSYTGLRLRGSALVDGRETAFEPAIKEVDQFTREIDHMSTCVLTGTQPHTGGAEGLQDMKLIAAIYHAAETGRAVALEQPAGPTRGPEPQSAQDGPRGG